LSENVSLFSPCSLQLLALKSARTSAHNYATIDIHELWPLDCALGTPIQAKQVITNITAAFLYNTFAFQEWSGCIIYCKLHLGDSSIRSCWDRSKHGQAILFQSLIPCIWRFLFLVSHHVVVVVVGAWQMSKLNTWHQIRGNKNPLTKQRTSSHEKTHSISILPRSDEQARLDNGASQIGSPQLQHKHSKPLLTQINWSKEPSRLMKQKTALKGTGNKKKSM
jgi:hypothetical protein